MGAWEISIYYKCTSNEIFKSGTNIWNPSNCATFLSKQIAHLFSMKVKAVLHLIFSYFHNI